MNFGDFFELTSKDIFLKDIFLFLLLLLSSVRVVELLLFYDCVMMLLQSFQRVDDSLSLSLSLSFSVSPIVPLSLSLSLFLLFCFDDVFFAAGDDFFCLSKRRFFSLSL